MLYEHFWQVSVYSISIYIIETHLIYVQLLSISEYRRDRKIVFLYSVYSSTVNYLCDVNC